MEFWGSLHPFHIGSRLAYLLVTVNTKLTSWGTPSFLPTPPCFHDTLKERGKAVVGLSRSQIARCLVEGDVNVSTSPGESMSPEESRRRLMERLRKEIGDERVMEAMSRVPREEFVSIAVRHLAYEDAPLSIGCGQTVSQPYIVALMTAAVEPHEEDTVMEVGAGSGYQAAILSYLVKRVITLERIPALADTARTLLRSLGYTNVEVHLTGETLGCPEKAPFDGILVTAAAPRLPRELLEQLVIGGRLVIPVGSLQQQQLLQVKRTEEEYSVRSLGACQFVPLVGPGAWADDDDEEQS